MGDVREVDEEKVTMRALADGDNGNSRRGECEGERKRRPKPSQPLIHRNVKFNFLPFIFLFSLI